MLMLDLRTCVLAAAVLLASGAVGGPLLWQRLTTSTDYQESPENAVDSPQTDVGTPGNERSGSTDKMRAISPASSLNTSSFWRGFGAWIIAVSVAPFGFRKAIRASLRQQSNYANAETIGIWLVAVSASAWFLWAGHLVPVWAVLSVITGALFSLAWFGLFCSRVLVWADR